MYRKKPEKWPRPVDFVILDFVSMHLSFLLACRIGQGPGIPYADPFYRNAAIMLSLLYLTFVLLGQNHKDRYRRGWGREFIDSARMTTYLVGLLLVYLFLTQSSTEYSRAVFLLLWGIQILLTYLLRMLRKWQIRRRQSRDTDVHSLILLTTSRRAEEMTRHLRERSNADLRLTGVGIVDGTQGRISIDGIPVIAGGDQIPEWIRRNWVDEVFLDTPADTQGSRSVPRHCGQLPGNGNHRAPSSRRQSGGSALPVHWKSGRVYGALCERCGSGNHPAASFQTGSGYLRRSRGMRHRGSGSGLCGTMDLSEIPGADLFHTESGGKERQTI